MLDIKSDLLFVNDMVHLPQKWNFDTPTILPSPCSYTTFTLHNDSWSLRDAFNIPMYKIVYWVCYCLFIMHMMRKYKAGESVPCYLRLINWCLVPPLRVKLFFWEATKLWTLRLSTSGKAAVQNPDLYFRSCSKVAVNIVFLKPTNKHFTYV